MKSILSLQALCLLVVCCTSNKKTPAEALIQDMQLKRGEVISCGPPDQQFGSATFPVRCGKEVAADFNLAISLLHSFEYDEAEKAFAAVIDKEPGCAMAYWGVAMSNFHPLWTPPTGAELEKGAKAVRIAQSLPMSDRERAYIDAIAAFYKDWQQVDHGTRTLAFEKGMGKVYSEYPDDKEAAILYALSLVAASDPADKTYEKQKKAGSILQALYPEQPQHPGIVHYLIHTYDYPELASQGLDAARKYASIAPSSAHALHMPSHIFTRLGLWNECIRSNIASVTSAKCYAEAVGIKGHWDEELHGLDYLVYAYLQKGAKDSARRVLDYMNSIREVHPINFKVAYAFAAIPSRYLLENNMWNEAAELEVAPAFVPWKNFPWQEAIFHFTRFMGAIRTGKMEIAKGSAEELKRLEDVLLDQQDRYKAGQVAIQITTAEAWLAFRENNHAKALQLMKQAAEMEDQTEKHPVTPGAVLPARELLGDMLLEMGQPSLALEAYEKELKQHPNRFRALHQAAVAAKASGDTKKATAYFNQLLAKIIR
ncbi:MAG TPA: hypothetical protein VFZ78_00685 [Flavisolibacter sp.]